MMRVNIAQPERLLALHGPGRPVWGPVRLAAVVLIADRRESFERLGELTELSPVTPTMLIDHPPTASDSM